MCPRRLWALAQPIALSSAMLYLLRCSVPAVGGCAGRAASECHVLLQSPVRSQPQKLRAACVELWWGHCCGLGPAKAGGHEIWAVPRGSGAAGAGSGQRATRAPAQYAREHLPSWPCSQRRGTGAAVVPGGCHGPRGLGQPHVTLWGCDTTGQRLLTLHGDLPAPERFGGDRPRFGREMG